MSASDAARTMRVAVTLWIVDIPDPKQSKAVGKFGDWIVGSVALLDDVAFIAGGELNIVDVSNPAAPRQVGTHRDVEIVTVVGENVLAVGGEGFAILRMVRKTGKD